MPIISKLMHVPNDQVGRLIGKSGCTIRQMQEVSGAHVEIAKTCAAGSTMRDVTLTGNEAQVARAEQLVNQKLAGQPLIPAGSTAAVPTWSTDLLVKIGLTSEAMARYQNVELLYVLKVKASRQSLIVLPRTCTKLVLPWSLSRFFPTFYALLYRNISSLDM